VRNLLLESKAQSLQPKARWLAYDTPWELELQDLLVLEFEATSIKRQFYETLVFMVGFRLSQVLLWELDNLL